MHYQNENISNELVPSTRYMELKNVPWTPTTGVDAMVDSCVEEKTKRRRRRRRGRNSRKMVMPHVSPQLFLPVPPRIVPPSFPFMFHPLSMNAMARRDCLFEDRQRRQAVALDCEMVGVGPFGTLSVLARVSLVSWDGHVLLNTFVKVMEPVTDYRTFVSGVRPCDLESPHAMDFGKCRLLVHQMLQNKILVGHGLANDLRVLRLTHPWFLTRDTATHEPFMRDCGFGSHGEKQLCARKLVELAKRELGVVIQGDEHDSIEDARCAMELYKKVQHDWDCVVAWKRDMETKMGAY